MIFPNSLQSWPTSLYLYLLPVMSSTGKALGLMLVSQMYFSNLCLSLTLVTLSVQRASQQFVFHPVNVPNPSRSRPEPCFSPGSLPLSFLCQQQTALPSSLLGSKPVEVAKAPLPHPPQPDSPCRGPVALKLYPESSYFYFCFRQPGQS